MVLLSIILALACGVTIVRLAQSEQSDTLCVKYSFVNSYDSNVYPEKIITSINNDNYVSYRHTIPYQNAKNSSDIHQRLVNSLSRENPNQVISQKIKKLWIKLKYV